MAFNKLLGSTQLLHGGCTVGGDCLEGKVVGLYFSAHWCPPCRAFTPVLAGKYQELQSAGKNFEIVFCSSDKTEESFDEYYKEMPWLALPYHEKDLKAQLAKKFKASSLPRLVILDTDGRLITADGRAALSQEEVVPSFPWVPPSLEELLGETFVKHSGEEVSFQSLQGSGGYLGVYFSAHWCPPCRRFTPELAKVYAKLKAAGKPFEVVFVSSDKTKQEFQEYFGEMPWLAMPYAARERQAKLSAQLKVNGLPTLVVLDSNLKVVNGDARQAVLGDPGAAEFPWEPRRVTDLDDCATMGNTATIVAMMEEAPDHWDAIEAAMERVARGGQSSSPSTGNANAGDLESDEDESEGCTGGAADDEADEEEEMNFCVAKESGGRAHNVRNLVKLKRLGSEPTLVLLDLGNKLSYYIHDSTTIDEATIKGVLHAFRTKTLKMRSVLTD